MVTRKDWEVLMNEAEEARNRGGVFETVHKDLNLTLEMYDKIMKEAKEAKIEKGPEATFEGTGAKIGRLVTEKNKAYGNSFVKSGEVLKILYPDGIALEDYKNVLILVRIIDKLFRICTNKDPDGENPFQDIAGYCILKVTEAEKKKS